MGWTHLGETNYASYIFSLGQRAKVVCVFHINSLQLKVGFLSNKIILMTYLHIIYKIKLRVNINYQNLN